MGLSYGYFQLVTEWKGKGCGSLDLITLPYMLLSDEPATVRMQCQTLANTFIRKVGDKRCKTNHAVLTHFPEDGETQTWPISFLMTKRFINGSSDPTIATETALHSLWFEGVGLGFAGNKTQYAGILEAVEIKRTEIHHALNRYTLLESLIRSHMAK